MKICYLCSDVDVQVLGDQGCSVHIREFTNALVDAGHDVFVLCSWLGGRAGRNPARARLRELSPPGLNQAVWESLGDEPEIINHFLERDLRSILWNTWLQIEGGAIFERERPDFVYERYALFGVGGHELCQRFGIPRILELNAPLCDQQEGYQYFPLIRTARELEPRILGGADAIVALTPWLADWAVGRTVDRARIHILPDAVSAKLFGEPVDGRRTREELKLPAQVVGFVGSFHRWHDVEGLIDAFARLFAAHPERRLLLVGDGHTRQKLENKVHGLGLDDAVVFAGTVPHEEVPRYLAAMDVAVVPYQPADDFFFSPMKLFESMAAGRPTVAANLGQIPDVVQHGTTGWLYPAGDTRALSEGIGALLEDRELAGRLGANAREYVLANHTWSKVSNRVVELARSLIETGRS